MGGKNKIAMPELKQCILELGYMDVVTYLNSGNVIFSCTTEEENNLQERIEEIIRDRFRLEIPVFLISQDALQTLLTHIPDWWGSEDKGIYDNLIFLMPSLTYERFCKEVGNPRENYEWEFSYENAIFWSFIRKDYQKTNWWTKTASTEIGKEITIRTANTVRKIAIL